MRRSTVTSLATRLLASVLLAASVLPAQGFDLQGHRGARGLAPENTLPAYQRALELGVDTLECDMAVTKDGVVVIHHDLWLNPDTTRGPDGKWLDARGPAIHDLTFAELQQYDVGRLKPGTDYAKLFPEQRPVDGTRIPSSRISSTSSRSRATRTSASTARQDLPSEPLATLTADEFARKVVAEIRAGGMQKRMMDHLRLANAAKSSKEAPELRTMYLTSPRTLQALRERGCVAGGLPGFAPGVFTGGSVPEGDQAGRSGKIWAPQPDVSHARRCLGGRRIHSASSSSPWTVNDPAMMTKLIDMGVDGIISDRPDLVQVELKKRK
jgi:glycerophosphoryl diester phosphodiesterase